TVAGEESERVVWLSGCNRHSVVTSSGELRQGVAAVACRRDYDHIAAPGIVHRALQRRRRCFTCDADIDNSRTMIDSVPDSLHHSGVRRQSGGIRYFHREQPAAISHARYADAVIACGRNRAGYCGAVTHIVGWIVVIVYEIVLRQHQTFEFRMPVIDAC